jgi:hypothetical protein
MSIPIHVKDTDHPEFVKMIKSILNHLNTAYSPNEVFIVRIRGWFDHKWLNFSGKGLIHFDSPLPNHPQVALDGFFQDQITFPPFTPKRILSQERWVYDDQLSKSTPPHSRRYQRSAMNLHRRIKDHSKSAIYMWYSSETETNKRGCLMVYRVQDEIINTWYASFLHNDSWQLDQTKGIERNLIQKLIDAEPRH